MTPKDYASQLTSKMLKDQKQVSPFNPTFKASVDDSSKKHNFEGKKDEKLKNLIHQSCQDLFSGHIRKEKGVKKSPLRKEQRKPKVKDLHIKAEAKAFQTRNVTPISTTSRSFQPCSQVKKKDLTPIARKKPQASIFKPAEKKIPEL